MALLVRMPLVGRSQSSEFSIGSTRNGGVPFVPGDTPWLSGADAMTRLFRGWTAGAIETSLVAVIDWCKWGSLATEGSPLAVYDIATDAFSDGGALGALLGTAATEGAASALAADRWWIPTMCMFRTSHRPPADWDGRSADQRDDLQKRLFTYVGTRLRETFLGAGGRAERFRFCIMPQCQFDQTTRDETRRSACVTAGLCGHDPNSPFAPVAWMMAATRYMAGSWEGVHNANYDNFRVGMQLAVQLSALVGGPNWLGPRAPYMGRPWRTGANTMKVPFYHPNGARLRGDSPGLRLATSLAAVRGSTDWLTIDSIDRTQAGSGVTIINASSASPIAAGSWVAMIHLANADDSYGYPQRPISFDVTPETEYEASDLFPGFRDLYEFVPPSVLDLPPMGGAQLSESVLTPDAWDGAVAAHPFTPAARSVRLTGVTTPGDGSVRAEVAVSGGVQRVRAVLRKGGSVVQTRSVALGGTGTVIFTGLVDGTDYRVEVRDEVVADAPAVVVT